MVCLPCIVIPVLLWVFHKFIGPWLNRIWSKPAQMVENVESNLVCPMPKKKKNASKANIQENGDTMKSESISESSNGSATEVNGHADLGERLKAE